LVLIIRSDFIGPASNHSKHYKIESTYDPVVAEFARKNNKPYNHIPYAGGKNVSSMSVRYDGFNGHQSQGKIEE
jgi:hypothetical protein